MPLIRYIPHRHRNPLLAAALGCAFMKIYTTRAHYFTVENLVTANASDGFNGLNTEN